MSESDVQYGKTALMVAAEDGHADCVLLLIDAGANTEAKTPVRRLYSSCIFWHIYDALIAQSPFCLPIHAALIACHVLFLSWTTVLRFVTAVNIKICTERIDGADLCC
jgi:hypothetical protein